MELNNLEKVNALSKIIKECERAKKEVDEYLETQDDDGYWCYMSGHSDGSGKIANMLGCYVGSEVAAATFIILQKKIDVCKEALADLGVTV